MKAQAARPNAANIGFNMVVSQTEVLMTLGRCARRVEAGVGVAVDF
jgi:hypothetical protein